MTASTDQAPVGWFSFEDRSVSARPPAWRAELRPVLRAYAGKRRADDVLLTASELVSNGTEHGGGVTCLRVRGSAGTVMVEVEDRDPRMERPDVAGADRGRGLAITEALSDDWGWHSTAGGVGKVVWARFRDAHVRQAV